MRKTLSLMAAAVAAVILSSGCDPDDPGASRPPAVSYEAPPTTAGDPDGPAVDSGDLASDSSECSTASGERCLPHFPASAPTLPPTAIDDPGSYSGGQEDSTPNRDADTAGNRRFDPDVFNCETMGNGTCDQGGIPVNGPDPVWHDGLPCYLDLVTPGISLTDDQYKRAHAMWCEPVA